MRVPDFFIVGAPKTGTTALYEMLRGHPQVYMPDLKEPRFLASDMRPRPKYAGEWRELDYPDTLQEYLALFNDAKPEQRVGEATTTYLWSRTAANSIADLQPDARIIAIVREPASFLRSLHLSFLRWGIESETDLRKAMALEAARRNGKHIPRRSHRPQLLHYSDHVRYLDQLHRYDARFPPEQILVLIHEDFHRDNEATARRVLRFLDLDDRPAITARQVNVTKRGVRSQLARDMMYSISKGQTPLARATKATIDACTPRRVRRGATRMIRNHLVRTDPPPLDESLMLELRHRFKGEVIALSEHLDRDLVSLWGYDGVV
jgi:Sulfotransferase family